MGVQLSSRGQPRRAGAGLDRLAGDIQLRRQRFSPIPLRDFSLGPAGSPVADALLADHRTEFPELIRPDHWQEGLSRLFLDLDPASDVAFQAGFEVGADGRLSGATLLEVRPEGSSDPQIEERLLQALSEFRFRPALDTEVPSSVAVTAWFVFHRELGLIPSVAPDSCVAPEKLDESPQFTPVDVPAELATPDWERARIIRSTWPLSLQEEGASYEFRLWLLVDERGRVCATRHPDEPEDRFVAHKAAAIAKRLMFRPSERDGRPTACWRQELLAFSF